MFLPSKHLLSAFPSKNPSENLVFTESPCTLARKYYIHKLLFSELMSRKITLQLQENIFRELISRKLHFPKITCHVFVCDSENYMEKLFVNFLLGKSHGSYINKVFGNNFAIISGWRVQAPSKNLAKKHLLLESLLRNLLRSVLLHDPLGVHLFSLNCHSCRHPYQTPHSLNCLPLFAEKKHWKCFVASPSPKSLLRLACVVTRPFRCAVPCTQLLDCRPCGAIWKFF